MRELQNLGAYLHPGYDEFEDFQGEEYILETYLKAVREDPERLRALVFDIDQLIAKAKGREDYVYDVLSEAGIETYGDSLVVILTTLKAKALRQWRG